MKFIKWLKEKWWIPLVTTIVVVLSVLLKPRTSSLHDLMRDNRDLEKKTKKDIQELEEHTSHEISVTEKDTENKLNKLKVSKGKKIRQIEQNKQELLDALSKHTNKELAEMLRKDDEV